jgi:DNA-binding HxlR family transcriptional regulator
LKTKKENKIDFRSQCPVSSALDIVGDKWTLLIIRDLCFFGKRTFTQFSESDEKIATNILADRLKKLEQRGIVTRAKEKGNRKTVVYAITEKGLDLIPVMTEYILWADKYLHHHIADKAKLFAESLRKNKELVIHGIASDLKKKDSISTKG